ncbi:MAG: BlaI/MecI/CopY family transcriptional regulator, partial [Clostridia bacterium]|nr:BlaI/MecI/CopY family transcriptional regulator [Clostridia bacterium]
SCLYRVTRRYLTYKDSSRPDMGEGCKEKLDWSRTTTYTVIKRLVERGILKNDNSLITSLVSKDEIQAAEIDELVEKKFEGSLPAFISAFTKHAKLSEKDIAELREFIERSK